MTIDWTTGDARGAEAGPETDRRVLRVMREAPNFQAVSGPKSGAWGSSTSTRTTPPLVNRQQVSRTPEGAHRARKWLREHVGPMLLDLDDIDAPLSGERAEAVIWDDGEEYRACAPTEHLATTRLVLLLAAEGVVDVGGEGDPTHNLTGGRPMTDIPDNHISDFDPDEGAGIDSIMEDLRKAQERVERNTRGLVAHISPAQFREGRRQGWIKLSLGPAVLDTEWAGGKMWPFDVPRERVDGLPVESHDYVDDGEMEIWERGS